MHDRLDELLGKGGINAVGQAHSRASQAAGKGTKEKAVASLNAHRARRLSNMASGQSPVGKPNIKMNLQYAKQDSAKARKLRNEGYMLRHTDDCSARHGGDCDCGKTKIQAGKMKMTPAHGTHSSDCDHRHGGDCNCGWEKMKTKLVKEGIGNVIIKKDNATHQTDSTVWPNDSTLKTKIPTLYHNSEASMKSHVASLKKKYGAGNVTTKIKKLGEATNINQPTVTKKKGKAAGASIDNTVAKQVDVKSAPGYQKKWRTSIFNEWDVNHLPTLVDLATGIVTSAAGSAASTLALDKAKALYKKRKTKKVSKMKKEDIDEGTKVTLGAKKLTTFQRMQRKTTNFLKNRDANILTHLAAGKHPDDVAKDLGIHPAIVGAVAGSRPGIRKEDVAFAKLAKKITNKSLNQWLKARKVNTFTDIQRKDQNND